MSDLGRTWGPTIKTAKYDLYSDFRKGIQTMLSAWQKASDAMLKKVAAELKKVDFILDMNKSDVSFYHSGSDGYRREGTLWIQDKVGTRDREFVKLILERNFDTWGTVDDKGGGLFVVDITES